jgi:NAD(P)H-nitrite reductase large subunit
MQRYVIIGSGAAGISAAEAIREKDRSGEITILGEERFGYYSRPGLAYFLSGEIPEHFLYPFSPEDYRRLGVQIRHERVTRIDRAARRVILEDGADLPYTRLLIATGAAAGRLRVPGAELPGVVKLDDMADVLQIHKLAHKAHSAVVVGGGITALEIVEGLEAQNVHTHYFLRGDRYWSNVLNADESHIVERRLTEDGIELHFKTELAEILERKGRVAGVRTKNNEIIPCEILGVAIGVFPRKDLAESAGLTVDHGIVVNETLQTSDPDIYAAGDVAQILDPVTGRYILDSLWSTSLLQGRAAGYAMSGFPIPYQKGISLNITRLAGLTTTIIGSVGGGRDSDVAGINRGDSDSWRQAPDALVVQIDNEGNRVRLQVGLETLVGAVVMGDQVLSVPLQNLIVRQADISPIRDRLLQPGAPIGEIITDYWTKIKRQYVAH